MLVACSTDRTRTKIIKQDVFHFSLFFSDFTSRGSEKAHSDRVKGFNWMESEKVNGVDLTFVPSKHWSGRGANDRFKVCLLKNYCSLRHV